MTLSYTTLYDAWLDVLTDHGVDTPTAQQILDITVGDPRTAWARARTDTEVAQLRVTLETALDELVLSTFDGIENHAAVRDELLTIYDDVFEEPAESDPETESAQYEGDPDSIYLEVEETDQGLTGAAVAGAGGDPDGDDITPRDGPLTDDDIWGEMGDSAESEGSQGNDAEDSPASMPDSVSDTTSDTTADAEVSRTTRSDTDEGQADEETAGTERYDEDPPFLPSVMAQLVLQNDSEEFNEALEPPLQVVASELLEFGTRSTAIYRTFVRDALFPQYEPEEAEELFETLVESRIRARLQQFGEQSDAAENHSDDSTSADGAENGANESADQSG